MDRAAVLNLLNEHREQVRERFGAKHLALFGSAARDELREDSDIDVLVEFEGSATFDGFMGLKMYLEQIFQARIDLATADTVAFRLDPIRQETAVLQFVQAHGGIKRENLMALCGLAGKQASALLSRLVSEGKLLRRGTKRWTYYIVAGDS